MQFAVVVGSLGLFYSRSVVCRLTLYMSLLALFFCFWCDQCARCLFLGISTSIAAQCTVSKCVCVRFRSCIGGSTNTLKIGWKCESLSEKKSKAKLSDQFRA